MTKIIQTPQQRANTLEALNVMWPSVPPENVAKGLVEWRETDEYCGTPPSRGTVACFGGWVEWWPPFRAQLGMRAIKGVMGWDDGLSLFQAIGLGRNEMFVTRGVHEADKGFTGTDHELVTHRLQWLLDNSEPAMTTQRLCGPQGQPCTRNCGIDCNWNTAETPHGKALRHFWEPNQSLHIDVYTGPSRLNRVLDWVGNYAEAAKTGFCNAFRDAWEVLPSVRVATGVVMACVFAAGVVVGFAR